MTVLFNAVEGHIVSLVFYFQLLTLTLIFDLIFDLTLSLILRLSLRLSRAFGSVGTSQVLVGGLGCGLPQVLVRAFSRGLGTPRVGGSFGSAGCGGVALVQIMRRWQWRNRDDYSHVLVTPPTAEL